MSGKRVLMFGYHGFRNAGAESRLVALIHALRGRGLTTDQLNVVTLHRKNLDYMSGGRLRFVHPAAAKPAVRRLIAESDLVLFSEGNMLSDAFTKHMVMTHTMVLEEAAAAGVPTAAIAIDTGPLHPSRQPRVMAALNTLDLLTLRTPGALEDLRARGLTVPAPVTADCAVSMPLPDQGMRNEVAAAAGLHAPVVHGLAPVDFHMYPARIAPFGRRADYVRYPFKGTWPDGGRARSAQLTETWASFGRRLLERDPNAMVAVVVMDPSDRAIAQNVARLIGHPSRVRLVTCDRLNTLQMSAALSRLSTIVTSRYHALVMPLAYSVPFIAVGHDNRTRFICDEMGMEKYFVDWRTQNLDEVLGELHPELVKEADEVRPRLRKSFLDFQERDQENYQLLAEKVTR